MSHKYNFQCANCEIELFKDLMPTKEKTLCNECMDYVTKFAVYIDEFKKEVPFESNQYAILRIVEYAHAMNTYATKLSIPITSNIKTLETIIKIASNDFTNGYNFHKLKYDIYNHCELIVRQEANERREIETKRIHAMAPDSRFTDRRLTNAYYASGSSFRYGDTQQKQTDNELKYESILKIITNPNEYVNHMVKEDLVMPYGTLKILKTAI